MGSFYLFLNEQRDKNIIITVTSLPPLTLFDWIDSTVERESTSLLLPLVVPDLEFKLIDQWTSNASARTDRGTLARFPWGAVISS
jgi:hypothetical protein